MNNKVSLENLAKIKIYTTEYKKRNPSAEVSYDEFLEKAEEISTLSVDGDIPVFALSRIEPAVGEVFRKYGFVTLADLADNYPSLLVIQEIQDIGESFSDYGLLLTLERVAIDTTADAEYIEDTNDFTIQAWKDDTLDDDRFTRISRQYSNITNVPVESMGLPTYIYTDLQSCNLKTYGDILELAKDERYFREYSLDDVKKALGTKRMTAGMMRRLVLSTLRIADGRSDFYIFR